MLPRRGLALSAVAVLVGVSACTDDSSTAGRGPSAPTVASDTVAQAPPTATPVPTSTTDPVAQAPQDTFHVDYDYPDGYVWNVDDIPEDTPCQWFTVTEFNSIIDRAQAKAGTDFTSAYFDTDSQCVTQVDPHSDSEEVLTWWVRAGTWDPDRRAAVSSFPVQVVVDDGPRDPGWDRNVSYGHPMLDDSTPYVVYGLGGGSGPLILRAELWIDDGPRLYLSTSLEGPATEASSDPEVTQKNTDPDRSVDWFDPELRPITERYDAFVLALANEIAIELGWHEEAT